LDKLARAHCEALNPNRFRGIFMKKDSQTEAQEAPRGMSLETIIAVGVFGWMALGMVMMGLGLW
jgi:hypothetical protein